MSDNKRHVHAELMMEYAIDASKTDKPWELYEWRQKGDGWLKCGSNPKWIDFYEYRRKPEMITVGKVSFPKPVDYELKTGAGYWVADWDCYIYHWDAGDTDMRLLKRGQIHLTKEAAQQHCDALIKISRGEF
ncbi:hypothetical protein [Photorhabdus sp. SF281]|uniref:hypothetical protein n=1 Tax=Photorhabdus sp. SF281 TaxID=3459527 RepID=UPI004044942F